MTVPRIEVHDLWKRYGLPMAARWHGLKQRLRGRQDSSLPWALQGISFEAAAGETLGVVGHNGSGKSTLLKVIAGVSPTTRGQVATQGAIFPMIELNAGIHGDLSGRENIHILGAVMGLSTVDVRQLLPKIEEFCELGEWFDRPVRTYSSGMLVRLGFAVGIHVHADILLMDEVMAVGDLHFHNKCMHELERLRAQGAAVLFVSHSMMRIRRMCDRVLVLDQGRQLHLGGVEEGVGLYERLQAERLHGREQETRNHEEGGRNFLHEGMGLRALELRHPGGGAPTESIPQGGEVEIRFILESRTPHPQAIINLALENAEGVSVVWSALELPLLSPGTHTFVVRWRELRLRSGSYAVRLGVTSGPFLAKILRSTGQLHLCMTGDDNVFQQGIHTPETAFDLVSSIPPGGAS